MAKRAKLGKKQTKEEIERPIRFRKYEYLFLIVCEDEKTEPTYFEQFEKLLPDEKMYIRRVGSGLDPKGVSERAVIEKEILEKEARREVDCVWIVFDVDDADLNEARIKRFNEAFEIAKKSKFNVAWSNEVFELWLLLHLTDIASSPALDRQEIYQQLQIQVRLQQDLNTYEYEHGDPEILNILQHIGDENAACLRAESLVAAHDSRQPINANPCTKIHLLVKELRTWIAYFNYKPS